VALNRSKFLNSVAERANASRRDVEHVWENALGVIQEAIKKGEDVSITGFGKFTTQRRAERQGVNPRNPSQKVTIPAATVPKFSAGSQLKQAVKGG